MYTQIRDVDYQISTHFPQEVTIIQPFPPTLPFWKYWGCQYGNDSGPKLYVPFESNTFCLRTITFVHTILFPGP